MHRTPGSYLTAPMPMLETRPLPMAPLKTDAAAIEKRKVRA